MKKIIYLSVIIAVAAIASCKKNSPNSISYSLTSTTKGWAVQNNPTDTFAFAQGHYQITLDVADALVSASAPYGKLNFPYTVQVDGIIQLQDTTGGKMGATDLIFNHKDDNNYSRVEIWSSGYYRVMEKTNGVFDTVANFTLSSFINAGNNSKNTVQVVQNSTSMSLMINGSLINSYSISLPDTLVTVGIGVTTGTATYTPTTGWFNNFMLSKN